MDLRKALVSETRLNTRSKILALASVVEIGTGLVFMLHPAIVVRLLLGVALSDAELVLGRCFGVALFALGLACWTPRHAGVGSPAVRAMLTYNALIALYLTYLGTAGHMQGLLLWPTVALHAVVALLLVWTSRDARRTGTTAK
jgi:hypothetical protein